MDQIIEMQTDRTQRREQFQHDSDDITVDDLQEVEYRPVPPQRALKVKVKIRVIGPGKPLRYPLADEA